MKENGYVCVEWGQIRKRTSDNHIKICILDKRVCFMKVEHLLNQRNWKGAKFEVT